MTLLITIAILFALILVYIILLNRRLSHLQNKIRAMEKAVLSLSKYNLAQARLIQSAADAMEKKNAEKQDTEAKQ